MANIQELEEKVETLYRIQTNDMKQVEKMIQQIEERLDKADIEGTFLTCQALRKRILG